jgi:hypothetical protein
VAVKKRAEREPYAVRDLLVCGTSWCGTGVGTLVVKRQQQTCGMVGCVVPCRQEQSKQSCTRVYTKKIGVIVEQKNVTIGTKRPRASSLINTSFGFKGNRLAASGALSGIDLLKWPTLFHFFFTSTSIDDRLLAIELGIMESLGLGGEHPCG